MVVRLRLMVLLVVVAVLLLLLLLGLMEEGQLQLQPMRLLPTPPASRAPAVGRGGPQSKTPQIESRHPTRRLETKRSGKIDEAHGGRNKTSEGAPPAVAAAVA